MAKPLPLTDKELDRVIAGVGALIDSSRRSQNKKNASAEVKALYAKTEAELNALLNKLKDHTYAK